MSFTDPDFAGGTLRVSGLLAEDRVGLAQDTGVTLDGSTVRVGGIDVGTLLGGVGADLTISLNTSASAATVETLIEHLTYRTASDTPSASRTLSISVIDGAGPVTQDPSLLGFSTTPDAANPFAGIDAGSLSTPALGDLDGDGDLDLVVGVENGTLRTFLRGADGSYAAQTGAANPFDGIDVGYYSTPALSDLDGDGDLDLVVGAEDGTLRTYLRGADGSYTARNGAANPFNGIDVDLYSTPALGDLDGDGDLDLVVGNYDGTLQTYLRGANGSYTAQTGAANPFNGIKGDVFSIVNLYSAPALGDLDADGDLDLVVGANDGRLRTYLRGPDGSYTARTGAANPFDGIDVGNFSTPSLGDLDGDGDLDLVVGDVNGLLRTYSNVLPATQRVRITVTAEIDAPVAVDDAGTVLEDGTIVLNVLANDTDVDGPVKTLTAVSVAPEQGTARIVDGQVVFTAAKDFNGVATLTYTVSDGSLSDEGQALVTVTPVNDVPVLAGLTPTITVLENAVNAAPARIDADVSFTDADFAGGILRVTGLLPEDRVGLAQDAGVSLDGDTVRVGGIDVGTLLGGVGADLTISLNTSASAATVETLIEHLTYRTVSDTPSASRTLSISVTDSAGAVTKDLSRPGFSTTPDAANPFAGIDVGNFSKPALGDLDGDGDLDLVVGQDYGTLQTYLRGADGTYTARTGAANPFDGIGVVFYGKPALVDLDGDGDLDLVVGQDLGTLRTYLRGADGSYIARTGAANPFDGIDVGNLSTPALGDLEGDGDLDLVVGASDGTLRTYLKGSDGSYTEAAGAANPFNGIDVGDFSTPALGDLDGDGDLDLVVGNFDGTVQTYLRGADGSYTAQIGAANPFNSIDVSDFSAPALGDLDGDGDLDLVVGASDGMMRTYSNMPPAPQVRITVTAENDAPVAVDDAGTVAEDGTVVLNVLANDIDDGPVKTLTAVSVALEQGTARIVNGQVVFTAAKDFNGIATLTYTVSDGSSSDEGQALVTVTPVNDVPVLAGLTPRLTVLENAAPARIDADVSFTDPDFAGGLLRVTGLLGEDRVGLAQDAGVTLDGSTVRVGGIDVGTLSGGVGADLTISLNASASAATVETLIEHLTYRTVSDTPSASRTLTVTVTDSAGAVTQDPFFLGFSTTPDGANPFAGIDVGDVSTPALGDLDGDGDLDLVVGNFDGMLRTYLRGADGSYIAQTGVADPFNGIDVGYYSTPALGDLDGDGDLDLTVGTRDGTLRTYLRGASGAYTETAGAANPFNGIDVGDFSTPALGDLDGDGDLDLVVGASDGTLRTYLKGSDGSYTEAAGAANPFNGIDVDLYSFPALGDFNGDGDLDLVVGARDGTLRTYLRGASGTYTEAAGAANPFDRIDVGNFSTPSLGDLDGDGDLDLVVGASDGMLRTYSNTPPSQVRITVTAENDAPVAVDDAGTVLEDGTVVLNVLANDTDSDGPARTLTAVSVAPEQGTARIVDGQVVFTAAKDFNGIATLTYTVSDGSSSDEGQALVTVTPINDVPVLTGLTPTLTVLENAVNAAPARIDADVSFTDPDFAGGTLRVSGLLAEDRVGLAQDAGVTLDGGTVRVGGVIVGTLSGGVGADLAISLNASASAATVETLIEHLTYRTVSDTPSASRTLTVTVTDSAGAVTQDLSRPGFSTTPDAANPFAGIVVGSDSTPALGDLDGDGDLDLVSGSQDGTLQTYLRGADGRYTEQTGTANPFNGIDVGYYSTPVLSDLDGDGDLDLVSGSEDGTLRTYLRGPDGSYTAQTGVANPFNGIDVGSYTTPALGDLDRDGDLDLVVGVSYGALWTYLRGADGSYTAPTDAANPFNGIRAGSYSTPALGDLDGDGDLDLVVGASDGTLRTYLRGPDGSYTAQTGVANPFNGIDVGSTSAPALGDLDGDGDLDLVVGAGVGTLRTYSNDTSPQVRLTVTAENDAPVMNATASVSTNEDTASSAVVIGVYDPEGGTLSYGLKAGDAPRHGTVRFDPTSGTFTYTPTADYAGADSFTIAVSDGQGGTSEQAVTVTVNPVNDPILAPSDADARDNRVAENAAIGTQVGLRAQAIDIDDAPGGTRYSLVDPTGEFAIDAITGVVTVAGRLDFEAGASRSLTIRATSQDGTSATSSFAVAVTDVQEVAPPPPPPASARPVSYVTLGAADDTFEGDRFANYLNGGGGRDTASGGAGDDTYALEGTGDTVIEKANEGIDTVESYGSYVLSANVENLKLVGLNLTGSGNELANAITGGRGNDILNGKAGNDYLTGGAGGDTFVFERGTGHDVVTDFAAGSAGTDIVKLVDFGFASFAEITAAMTQVGADTQLKLADNTYVSFLNHAVRDFVADDFGFVTPPAQEPATLPAIPPASAKPLSYVTHGAGDDTFEGDRFANYLNGGAGRDTTSGGDGDDTYGVEGAGDTVIEKAGEGIDTVESYGSYVLSANVENLKLVGLNLTGTGNELANAITGGRGNDILNGKAGSDYLTGGAGGDTFVFERGTGHDVVTDFAAGSTGTDVVDLRTFSYGSFDQIKAGLLQAGETVQLKLQDGSYVSFLKTSLSQFDAGDFML